MTPQQMVAECKVLIREVSSSEAAWVLKEGALCLDVREADEFKAEHLPDAINIPRGILEFRIGDIPSLANKDATLLVYCKSGGRSALAALSLQRLGYGSILSIAGGIDDWKKSGLECVVSTDR
jgi:rhodanese-related sulfurtransferase